MHSFRELIERLREECEDLPPAQLIERVLDGPVISAGWSSKTTRPLVARGKFARAIERDG